MGRGAGVCCGHPPWGSASSRARRRRCACAPKPLARPGAGLPAAGKRRRDWPPHECWSWSSTSTSFSAAGRSSSQSVWMTAAESGRVRRSRPRTGRRPAKGSPIMKSAAVPWRPYSPARRSRPPARIGKGARTSARELPGGLVKTDQRTRRIRGADGRPPARLPCTPRTRHSLWAGCPHPSSTTAEVYFLRVRRTVSRLTVATTRASTSWPASRCRLRRLRSRPAGRSRSARPGALRRGHRVGALCAAFARRGTRSCPQP